MTEQKEIEFETVTLKVPKRIMDLLRDHEKDVKGYLEYLVVDSLRSEVDAEVFGSEPKEVADAWKLNPVFKAIVNHEVI